MNNDTARIDFLNEEVDKLRKQMRDAATLLVSHADELKEFHKTLEITTDVIERMASAIMLLGKQLTQLQKDAGKAS